MKITKLISVALLLITVFSLNAHAVGSPQFFSSIPDMPLMDGLTELTDQTIVFDKPEGRIVESVALIDGQAPDSVLQFYDETLPQLGWTRIADLSFRRENEVLKMSVEGNEGKNFLHVNIAPASLPPK
jgi:hypothetical protein